MGVCIVSLAPGVIETNIGLGALRDPEVGAQVRHLVAVSSFARTGKADEIASVVEFLISEKASYITGTDILEELEFGGDPSAARSHVDVIIQQSRENTSGSNSGRYNPPTGAGVVVLVWDSQ